MMYLVIFLVVVVVMLTVPAGRELLHGVSRLSLGCLLVAGVLALAVAAVAEIVN
jgi:hypothetical protein